MYYQEEAEKKERRKIIAVATISVIIILILIVAIIVVATKKTKTTGANNATNSEMVGSSGRRRPSSLDDGGISGLFSRGGPSVRFLTRYDGEVSEPLVGRQGSRVSMRVARGSASLLPSHGRGIWPRDVLKKVSRGLSRVEAGNPGFPRLVQVTSGGFSWWL